MVERLRSLLDRPLDPSTGRAIVVLASAIFLGFGVLALLASFDRPAPEPAKETAATAPRSPVAAPPAGDGAHYLLPRPQDPQDRRGSAEARRAARALRDRRALQHVPYRCEGLAITLVGADRGRAVLRVLAPTAAAARRGWREFLRRHRDPGGAYLVRFEGDASADGCADTCADGGAAASPGSAIGALADAAADRGRRDFPTTPTAPEADR